MIYKSHTFISFVEIKWGSGYDQRPLGSGPCPFHWHWVPVPLFSRLWLRPGTAGLKSQSVNASPLIYWGLWWLSLSYSILSAGPWTSACTWIALLPSYSHHLTREEPWNKDGVRKFLTKTMGKQKKKKTEEKVEPRNTRKRNELRSFREMWMDLDSVIQSKVNQKEKNKSHMLTHIWRIKKNGKDEPISKARREMQM